MQEVTKSKFREAYIHYGKLRGGYDLAYWDKAIDTQRYSEFKYLLAPPVSQNESRLMITTDFSKKELRMFFISEENEENLFTQGSHK